MEKLNSFFNKYLNNQNFVCLVFRLHSCGLGMGYSFVGWVGHGLQFCGLGTGSI